MEYLSQYLAWGLTSRRDSVQTLFARLSKIDIRANLQLKTFVADVKKPKIKFFEINGDDLEQVITCE
jgi:hypothetical protein